MPDHSGLEDQQAMEMATYAMDMWVRWDLEHHAQPHTTPIKDCLICRWGCDVRDCDCAAVVQKETGDRDLRGSHRHFWGCFVTPNPADFIRDLWWPESAVREVAHLRGILAEEERRRELLEAEVERLTKQRDIPLDGRSQIITNWRRRIR